VRGFSGKREGRSEFRTASGVAARDFFPRTKRTIWGRKITGGMLRLGSGLVKLMGNLEQERA